MSATAAISYTSSTGLVGVSMKKVLVSLRTAFFQAPRSLPSTSVDVTPKRPSQSSITQRHEPNNALAATM
jgi:hypothetical protein